VCSVYKDIPDTSGVYLITNTVTGKVYVGSARRMRPRLQAHRTTLRAGKHHSSLLQRAWDKYGEGAFVAAVIEECAESDLRTREQLAIDARGASDRERGYNLNPNTAPGRGLPHREETKRKIGAANRGKGGSSRRGIPRPAHVVEAMRPRFFTGHPSRDVMEAAWAASRGNSFHLGHTHSDDVRARMSEKTRGEKHPRAVLTEDAVREIREARGHRGMPRILADKFGVSLSTVYETQRGRYWRHVGSPLEASA
jgi:group I intron endonuclease